MSKKDESKSRKRLTLSLGLVASLGILSIVYAVVSSQLTINSQDSGLVSKQGMVQFGADENDAFAFSAGTDTQLSSTGLEKGPFYSSQAGVSGNAYDLKSETSPSYLFAKAGDVAISTNKNTNDTATISGTKLFDSGAYVVYKLKVKNTSSEFPMRLSEITYETRPDDIGINVQVYDGDPDSSSAPLSVLSLADANRSTTNASNYLTKGGETEWYVKVSCNNPTNFASQEFSFTVKPTWMPVQK